jgi:AAA15 family ATPase/GTPase
MYKTFTIKNFRCFEDLTISDLDRVNLFVGKNNVGKTALLEAFFLHYCEINPESIIKLDIMRNPKKKYIRRDNEFRYTSEKSKSEDLIEPPWFSIFHNFNLVKEINLSKEDKDNLFYNLSLSVINKYDDLKRLVYDEMEILRIEMNLSDASQMLFFLYENFQKSEKEYLIFNQGTLRKSSRFTKGKSIPFFQSDRVIIDPIEQTELYSNIDKKGKQDMILQSLLTIEPRLKRLSINVQNGIPILHGGIEGLDHLIPLSLMGDGMSRLTNIVLYIANSPDSIVLIDEIENGFHHTIMKDVWRVIDRASQLFNTQIFATTHSRECAMAAHEAFSESASYDFRVHKLGMKDNKIKAITYDRDSLKASFDINMEIR